MNKCTNFILFRLKTIFKHVFVTFQQNFFGGLMISVVNTATDERYTTVKCFQKHVHKQNKTIKVALSGFKFQHR